MDKKPLIGVSILAVVLLVMGSLSNVVGYQTVRPLTTQTSSSENWTEIQKILPSVNGESFGWSVSIDNDTALVGAIFGNFPNMNSRHQGSVYVFTREGFIWTLQAKLYAPDGQATDQFGWAVSIDGDTAIIGACNDDDKKGSAYVFTRNDTTWSLQNKLVANDGEPWDLFGCSVSLDNDTAFIGAEGDAEGSGSVYVFTRNGSIWTQQQKLVASEEDNSNYFGTSISLDGNTALIGSLGSVYVFICIGLVWSQQLKLSSPDSDPWEDFGCSVSLDGETALIGALQYNYPGYASNGSAYIFIRIGNDWYQQGTLTASDGTPEDDFGYSVSLDKDTALVGALHGYQNNSGSVYVYTRCGTLWTEQAKLVPSDGQGDLFGIGLCVRDDVALIGAPLNDEMGYASGAVYSFTRENVNLDVDVINSLGVQAIITNWGVNNLSNVEWQIHVEGGILHRINTTLNGTIDLQAGDSKTVKTTVFFGLGPIIITVKAFDVTKTIKGTYLFLFSII